MMVRLYFRIYLAVLGSLALFAVLAAIGWKLFADFDRFSPDSQLYQAVAERMLPPSEAPSEEQLKAIQKWQSLSGYNIALFANDGKLIADTSNGILKVESEDRGWNRASRWRKMQGVYAMTLQDGRELVVARPVGERSFFRRFGLLIGLLAIAIAVGISAYPVVRRLTRRLEKLHVSVAALGSGDLSARVAVEGKDEIARLAETFNRSADRIQTLVVANRSLLANASHELRSPLARLRMGIEALPDTATEKSRNELNRNIRELDQLIEEILLTSRLDAQNDKPVDHEPIDLVALVAEECAQCNADLTITTDALPMISGDPRLMVRLFRNLLENAERYGKGMPVEVTIHPPGNNAVVVDICDRGPGIPADESERIFEPFYRARGAGERSGGVGLGLALVRQIAERHGATVRVLARDGGGSCFRVRLPTVSTPAVEP
ncbi:MAG: ATP-binding protein [Beijerinckiaceae bacterium]